MANIGIAYCRVSTKKQEDSLKYQEHQLLELSESVGYISSSRLEIASAKGELRSREGLSWTLDFLMKFKGPSTNNALFVTRIDRVSRSKKELIRFADFLTANQIKLFTLEGEISPDTQEGRDFILKEADYAQREAELLSLRTKEGLERARSQGRFGGRRPKLTEEQKLEVKFLYHEGIVPVKDIAARYGITSPTVYRAVEAAN